MSVWGGIIKNIKHLQNTVQIKALLCVNCRRKHGSKMAQRVKLPAAQPDSLKTRDAVRDCIPGSCLLAHFYICAEVHVPQLTYINKIDSFWLIKEIPKVKKKCDVGACFWALGNRRQSVKCMELGTVALWTCFRCRVCVVHVYGVWQSFLYLVGFPLLARSLWHLYLALQWSVGLVVPPFCDSLTTILGWLMF